MEIGVFLSAQIEKLIESLFFRAAFLALAINFSKLVGADAQTIYIDLNVVKEQVLILFLLCFFIARMDETPYRRKVLAWLKALLFVLTAGSVARKR